MKNSIQIIPYLHYGGNCEEALQFYQKAVGGNLTVVNRYDNPAMKAPESYKNKILHARLEFDGGAIYASDVFPGQSVAGNSGDVSISLLLNDDVEHAKNIFKALSSGGKVGIPFEKQFWGDWHGGLTDQFGFKWNINFMEK